MFAVVYCEILFQLPFVSLLWHPAVTHGFYTAQPTKSPAVPYNLSDLSRPHLKLSLAIDSSSRPYSIRKNWTAQEETHGERGARAYNGAEPPAESRGRAPRQGLVDEAALKLKAFNIWISKGSGIFGFRTTYFFILDCRNCITNCTILVGLHAYNMTWDALLSFVMWYNAMLPASCNSWTLTASIQHYTVAN